MTTRQMMITIMITIMIITIIIILVIIIMIIIIMSLYIRYSTYQTLHKFGKELNKCLQ